MIIAWYLCPYRKALNPGGAAGGFAPYYRYCAMCDYNSQIFPFGGLWSETEVLGNYAIVKVKAPDTLIPSLDAEFYRLPVDNLDDFVDIISAADKTKLINFIKGLGYGNAEVNSGLGNLNGKTLRNVLKFVSQRRLAPRWDNATQEFVCDGVQAIPKLLEDVDARVF